MSEIEHLPREMILHILSFIPGCSMLNLGRTSWLMYAHITSTLPKTITPELYNQLVFHQDNYLVFARYPMYSDRYDCVLAVEHDLRDVFNVTHNILWHSRCVERILELDRLNIYECLYTMHKAIYTRLALQDAINNKAWKITRWLIDKTDEYKIKNEFARACNTENLEALDVFIDHFDVDEIQRRMVMAISIGKIKTIKYLLDRFQFNSKWLIATAIEERSLDSLQYLLSIYNLDGVNSTRKIDKLLKCELWNKAWLERYFSTTYRCGCGHTMDDHTSGIVKRQNLKK